MSSIPFIDASNCCTLQVSQVPKLHMVHFIFNCQIIGFLFYYHFVKPCSFLQLAILPLFVPLTVLFSKQEGEVDRRNVLLEHFYIVLKGDIF